MMEIIDVQRLRETVKLLKRMAVVFNERASSKEVMMNRLSYIFGDDDDLAKTIYDYVIRGHLSHCNYLRDRFRAKPTR